MHTFEIHTFLIWHDVFWSSLTIIYDTMFPTQVKCLKLHIYLCTTYIHTGLADLALV